MLLLLLLLLLLLMQRLATLAGGEEKSEKGEGKSEEGSCTHPTPTQRFTGRVIRAVDVAVGVNVDCGVGSAAAVTAY